MHKIETLADLLREYPGIAELPRIEALLLAYKMGRCDGSIEVLEQQAIIKAKRDAEDDMMDEPWGNA